jgi:primosomal protein N' (replication factor Y)
MSELSDIVAVMVSVSVEGPYSYRVPPGMQVVRGSIVAVPLVGRLTLGVVWGEPKDNFAHNRLKDIEIAYDVPPLSDELLRTVDWVPATRWRRRGWSSARCCAPLRRSSPTVR